ncbi:hypothetical protein FRB94_014465 [Tulasnella sp. JGI-2019a]|nr:hypothetical protein FRB94_014465 [Tulasnella sp. JGI-2019a]
MRHVHVHLPCAFLPFLAHCIVGFNLFRSPSPSRPSIPQLPAFDTVSDIAGLLPQSEFHEVFRGWRTVNDMPSEPDCFGSETASVLERCGEELELSDNERVQFAIGMTLCELKTAKHNTPPLECRAFSSNNRVAFDRRSTQSSCVAALARSAQFWSSYSGYIRQVSQLCHAFRRSHDIDTARSLYRNATLEKVALLRVLSRRETALNDVRSDMRNILDGMVGMLYDLQSRSSELGSVRGTIVDVVDKAMEELLFRHEKLAKDTQSELMDVAARNQAELVQNTQFQLRGVLDAHASSLSTLAEAAMKEWEEHFHRVLSEETETTLAMMHVAQTDIANMITSLRQDFAELSGNIFEFGQELSLQRVDHHREVEKSIQSLSHLTLSIESLAIVAQERLSAINQTAWEVQKTLGLSGSSPWFMIFGLGTWASMVHALIILAMLVFVALAVSYLVKFVRVLIRAATALFVLAIFLVVGTYRALSGAVAWVYDRCTMIAMPPVNSIARPASASPRHPRVPTYVHEPTEPPRIFPRSVSLPPTLTGPGKARF